MAELLPKRDPVDAPDRDPRTVELVEGNADEVFSVLSSPTARTILAELYREEATLSDLSDRADTSLQNAKYHVERLQAAELVEVVGTWYSSRGHEMDVYSPTSEPLLLIAGDGDRVGNAVDGAARRGAAD